MTTVLANDAWPAFESRLRAYVHARVDAAWADDVVSDIVLRLVQHRVELESAQKPLAWMFRVATHAITDHYRRRSTEQRMMNAVAVEQAAFPASTNHSSGAELAQCLVPLIRGLPPLYSEALLLTDIEELTQAEAAQSLGLSTSGMKSRVQRGRAKLKQALLRCCEIELDKRSAVTDYRECTGGDVCNLC